MDEFESISAFKKRTNTYLTASTLAAEAHVNKLEVYAKRSTSLLYKNLDSLITPADVPPVVEEDPEPAKAILATPGIKRMRVKYGNCYLLEYKFNDLTLMKIGYTTKTVEERVTSIVEGSMEKFGTFVEVTILDRFSTSFPFLVEKELHAACAAYSYHVDKHIVAGYTELFDHTEEVRAFFKSMKP